MNTSSIKLLVFAAAVIGLASGVVYADPIRDDVRETSTVKKETPSRTKKVLTEEERKILREQIEVEGKKIYSTPVDKEKAK